MQVTFIKLIIQILHKNKKSLSQSEQLISIRLKHNQNDGRIGKKYILNIIITIIITIFYQV